MSFSALLVPRDTMRVEQHICKAEKRYISSGFSVGKSALIMERIASVTPAWGR